MPIFQLSLFNLNTLFPLFCLLNQMINKDAEDNNSSNRYEIIFQINLGVDLKPLEDFVCPMDNGYPWSESIKSEEHQH